MFLRDLLERAGKTFVQTAVATFAAMFVVPADYADLNAWKAAALAAGIAAVAAGLSAVSSIVSRPLGTPGTAGIVNLAPELEEPRPVSPFVD